MRKVTFSSDEEGPRQRTTGEMSSDNKNGSAGSGSTIAGVSGGLGPGEGGLGPRGGGAMFPGGGSGPTPVPDPHQPTQTPTLDLAMISLQEYKTSDYATMEEWLDSHPDFAHEYFTRKASRTMVDSWLINNAFSGPGSARQAAKETDNSNNSGSNSKASSGANTPVRKISAQEFERGGQILKPMVSTVDGTPTFLGSMVTAGTSENILYNKGPRKSVSELKALDERELMYELVIDICNDLDVTSLCHKILQNVCLLVKADRCSLFLVQGEGESRHLVSKLFDVTSQATLQDCMTEMNGAEVRVPWGSGIVGHVAQSGQPLNIPEAYQDARFNDEIDIKTGYKTRSILSMPIKDLDGHVIGVAMAINKLSVKDEPFDEHDEKVFSSYLAFCGIGIRNAQLYERSLLENKRNQLLLDLARIIFEETNNIAKLIHKIMMHTQSLLRCERCQVLLVDETTKESGIEWREGRTVSKEKNAIPRCKRKTKNPRMGVFSQVFDLQASDFDNDDSYHREGVHEPRFPINIGITGYVAATGERLNIPDASKDNRFDPTVDDESGFRTSCILCMPIKNAHGHVIGVSQLVNKLDGTPFNKNDENLFEAFAIFCGLGINNTQMYEKAVRAVAKQRVALEVLSYHASAPPEDVLRIKKVSVPSTYLFRLLDVGFTDFILDDDDTVRACVRMFLELDFLEKFRINYETLCRWLLSVKKNYRNVTYHNWRHAFNVAQTMFWMMVRGDMRTQLTDLECLALLIACLCHDLDHRGTNNQFQIKTMSPLAQLYSTSVLEHHHFDQCIMILNTKGNEILANLPQDHYEQCIRLLEGAILATDLALYFRYRGEFFNLVDSCKLDYNVEDHRDLLRSMMMTACDVSAITKPWDIQKKVAVLVASEFFEQGDLEKAELHIKPMDMMDRDKKDQLPSMQVGFIDSICLPVYQALARLQSDLKPLMDGCRENRTNWLKLSERRCKSSVDEQDRETHHKDDISTLQQQSTGDSTSEAIRKISPPSTDGTSSSGSSSNTAIRKISPTGGNPSNNSSSSSSSSGRKVSPTGSSSTAVGIRRLSSGVAASSVALRKHSPPSGQ